LQACRGGIGGSSMVWCFPYAGDYDSVPAGYFFANGASKSTTTYAALFNVIGPGIIKY
jgi:hypothetical protein